MAAEATARPVHVLGVNAAGEESGNGRATQGRTLPWLQDTRAESVWTRWQVSYRDVIVLDFENRVVGTYNLTSNDLATSRCRDELKALLRQAASR